MTGGMAWPVSFSIASTAARSSGLAMVNALALEPGAAGAADAVHVVLGMVRHVEVEHVRQAADVEPARRHVAAHQQLQLARLEFLQRGEAHGLRHVAMQRAVVEAVARQRFVQDVHVALAIAEHQCALDFLGAHQPAQRLALVVVGHQHQPLGDRGRDRGGARDTTISRGLDRKASASRGELVRW